MTVVLRGEGLTAADVVAVARRSAVVALGDDARDAVDRSHDVIVALAGSGQPVYGVSTGFGSLADVYIDPERRAQLQRSLVRSHAAGLGPPVERRGRAGAWCCCAPARLAMGWSGVRAGASSSACSTLLNAGLTPIVREHGSLGCSGDLAPLAHVALVLMGEGEV